VIVEMRKAYNKGEDSRVSYLDWAPQWAHKVKAHDMYATGGWHDGRKKDNFTFGDSMRNKWNNPMHPRSPFIYFEGVMRPVGVDSNTGDVIYAYRDWHEGFDRNKVKQK